MKQDMVNKPNTGDLEDPINNLMCAIHVGAQFAEDILNRAASGHPFAKCDANAAVWALNQITYAAEVLDEVFRDALAAHYASRRQA